MKQTLLKALINFLFVTVTLSSCRDVAKRESLTDDLTPQDMKNLVTPLDEPGPSPRPLKAKNKFDDIPAAFLQPVSVNLSEATPLKPVLIELARQANIDLQLDPKIDKKIVFTAKNKPFIQVIESICELAGLRYKIVDHSLRIEADLAYVENYNVQFLNLARNTGVLHESL